MNTNDTIIAPATAPGDGGIAIVRISGPLAYEGLRAFFHPTATIDKFVSHHLYHGLLKGEDGGLIDEVMAVFMAAPRTYTRDDVVEIQCHGGHQVVSEIINLYLSFGLRLAQPGEFTYRAYMSGRLDLSQAEAVSKLISAKNTSSYRLALSQAEGLLSRQIHSFTEKLKHALVLTEAWIDFPEENIPEEDVDLISSTVDDVEKSISQLLDSYNSGRVFSEGAQILLVGQPNVGKSSLLNALLGEQRAIVTDVPGTTRDLLEEGLVINGVPVRLIDTAGLHDSADLVEKEGIRRAQSRLASADLVLLLVDSSTDINDLDNYVHNQCAGLPVFLVMTKTDLDCVAVENPFPELPVYRVSSKTGEGLDILRTAISQYLVGSHQLTSESVLLTEKRHYEALVGCDSCLVKVRALLGCDTQLELLAFELREALHVLGLISGETTTESLLDDIFSGFCIGK